MKKIAELIIKLKYPIIVTISIITAFFAYEIKNIKINSDIISTLPDDDPAALLHKKIGAKFGGNDMVLIVLETDNIFKPEVLQHVKQITDTLKTINGISTVTSLTNIIDIKNSDFGIEIGKLIDEYNLPANSNEIDSLRNYIFSKEMYKGSIVSDDATATLVMFTIASDADKESVSRTAKEKTESLNLPETLHFGGLPAMMNDINDLIVSDMIWLIPVVFVPIALVLLISFRSLGGVLMPLLVSAIAVIWVLGFMSITGYELTIISNEIPIILLAVGSAYTIHVLNNINRNEEENINKKIIKSLSYIILPVFLAAITTAIGFVSFIFGSYLTIIRDFGILTALGVAVSFILSVVFVPALLAALNIKKSEHKISDNQSKNTVFYKIILKPLSIILLKHPKYIMLLWTALMLICAGGIFFINTSVNMTEYFKKDNPTRVSEDIMQKKFGGSMPVFVSFKGDIQNPKVLKTIIETENYMKKYPHITHTQSVADLVEQMNDIMGEGKKIPDERAKVEQLWFLLNGQDIMNQLVTDNLDQGIIQSKFASINSKTMADFSEYMNKFVKEKSRPECQIEVTGMPSIYNNLNNSLLKSQFGSLILAVSLVSAIVGLMLRSLRQGIIATVPIIATIIILFGFMGYTGIPLDIATVLVGSIALGIGIDYSIHVISHFNHALKEKNDIKKALEETIFVSGNAVIINVLSVSAGFMILLFSKMVPLQNFGLLVALSMFGSGLGSLTLLPVLIIFANKKITNEKQHK